MAEKEKKKAAKKGKGEGEGEGDGKKASKEKEEGESKKGGDGAKKASKGEEKEGKSGKGAKDALGKSKKDKDPQETNKDGEKAIATSEEPVDPNALPPLDPDGNPICVQPDPPPTFAELWFDDPVEGEAAQKLALELRAKIELKALSIRKFLEGAIVPLLLQGLQHMVLERPTNPAEYLAAFLLKNNPLKDVQYVEPPADVPPSVPPPVVEPPKCSCCAVHCPPPPPVPVPDFFRKSDHLAKPPAEAARV